jgi:DNA-binding NarL/FixJ family response regulator
MDTMTAPRSGSDETSRHGGTTRVLIVDDHALLADGLYHELAAAGFETEAIGGPTRDAILECARAWEPHVVLLDLHLGEAVGSGLDLIGSLAELGAAVVVLTGTTDQLLLAACVETGAVGIVSKTESLAGLSETVARAARSERLIPITRREEMLDELRSRRRTERSREELFRHMTPRECEVLASLMQGASAAEIARASCVSLATVRTQIRSILQKLDANSQLAAVAIAYRAGWTHEPAATLVVGERRS